MRDPEKMTGLTALNELCYCKSVIKCKVCRHASICTMPRDYELVRIELDLLKLLVTKGIDLALIQYYLKIKNIPDEAVIDLYNKEKYLSGDHELKIEELKQLKDYIKKLPNDSNPDRNSFSFAILHKLEIR